MNIKGTKSEKNVLSAFGGESKARNKYTYYAAEAKKEGLDDIASLFEKMADNEREHAKIWFKVLNGDFVSTEENLKEAAIGENFEWKSMYPKFAAEAREEGLEMLAIMFEKIAAIENDHEKRFLEAYLNLKIADKAKKENVPYNEIAKQNTETSNSKKTNSSKNYRCMFCGNMEESNLDVCPVCEAIGAFEYIK